MKAALAALLLYAAIGAGVSQAQGNATPSQSGQQEDTGGAQVIVGAGTTPAVTTGSSGPDDGASGAPEVKTDPTAGRNAECRATDDLSRTVACLQGYPRLLGQAEGEDP
jgi:hypothetical protein